MNKNSLTDYAAYSLLKIFGPLLRALPRGMSFAFGRFIGDLVFIFDFKHRELAYANIRTAFASSMPPRELRRVTRQFFRSYGQNVIEIFLIPVIDSNYMRDYVRMEGLEHVAGAFSRKKGVLLCSVHAGSWELANILSANLGFPFSLFVREQKFPLIEGLLNKYRKSKGCRLIQREDQLRELIRVLRNNESTGLTVDQGGRGGTPVQFFGKQASMSSGAVRLALKYGCSLVPVYFRRVSGPHLEITVGEPLVLKQTGDIEKDTVANLQEFVRLFEQHIRRYPHEYLWSYKVWKYSRERKILILSDGKTGHLRQSQALAQAAAEVLAEKGIRAAITEIEVTFKNGLAKSAAACLNVISGRHICRGCSLCLRTVLEPDSYAALLKEKFDLVISCGSSLSATNYILSRENAARSFVIMRPSIAPLNRFDLAVIPEHDRPPRAKNVVAVTGALNLVTPEYLREQMKGFSQIDPSDGRQRFAFLIGGDTKELTLNPDIIRDVCRQMARTARNLGAELLITTSRRSSARVELTVKEECSSARVCVIASEANLPFTVGGFLGLASVVVCSPESISMISEAASSGAYVVVFLTEGLGHRHLRFLKNLSDRGNIYLADPRSVGETIERLAAQRPEHRVLADREIVKQAVRKILS